MTIMWNPKMSVGNTFIDEEHKYLLCLINTVELAVKTNDRETMKMALEALVEYTHEHFSREEKLMLKTKYHYYADHKREHQELLAEMDATKDRFLLQLSMSEGDEAADQPALDFDELGPLLRHWILDHVLKTDMKMKPHLQKQPPNLTG